MNQSTFSFPQLINRTTRKIELSTNTENFLNNKKNNLTKKKIYYIIFMQRDDRI